MYEYSGPKSTTQEQRVKGNGVLLYQVQSQAKAFVDLTGERNQRIQISRALLRAFLVTCTNVWYGNFKVSVHKNLQQTQTLSLNLNPNVKFVRGQSLREATLTYIKTRCIAYLGGVCSAKRKCVLAEDNGLNLAFTIAHELGHNMGMSHDDDHATCTGHSHIMSGEWVKGRNPSDLSWSSCSRDDLENFLRSKASGCLLYTDPRSRYQVRLPPKLPGMHYSVDEQCQILFGTNATFCNDMEGPIKCSVEFGHDTLNFNFNKQLISAVEQQILFVLLPFTLFFACKIGCDGIIGSLAKEDRCGVCNGDGRSCKIVRGDFNHTKGMGYIEAVVIPAGARRIKVVEDKPSHSFLALKDSSKRSINSDWKIELPGEFELAGTTVRYVRRGLWEKMSAKGPTKTPLHLMVLLFHDQSYGIHYEYTVSLNVSQDRSSEEHREQEYLYIWTHSSWQDCTVQCGGASNEVNMAFIATLLEGHQKSLFAELKSTIAVLETKLDNIQTVVSEHVHKIASLESNGSVQDERVLALKAVCASCTDSHTKLQAKLLAEVFGKNILPSPSELDRVHRAFTAKPRPGETQRAVISWLHRYQQKERIVCEARAMRGK
ncbi:hypothetical protein F2P81_004995 [Scophthalmus maximus]|uniref:Peptidase M12B domain-containing protein n=1 Tax=Scophthalmus maximus TaxID=52904 RepID=A0A6A4TGS6_SCOMX|nr:hypothetical protein F2P81_004995 [Scophthalmus maximus]